MPPKGTQFSESVWDEVYSYKFWKGAQLSEKGLKYTVLKGVPACLEWGC